MKLQKLLSLGSSTNKNVKQQVTNLNPTLKTSVNRTSTTSLEYEPTLDGSDHSRNDKKAPQIDDVSSLMQIIKDCVDKRDHSVTFLPLLATVVMQNVSGSQFVKSLGKTSGGSAVDRVLTYEESYRLIWETLQRLHNHRNNRAGFSSSGYNKRHHQLEKKKKNCSNPNVYDENIQLITYSILKNKVFMNDNDIDFVVGLPEVVKIIANDDNHSQHQVDRLISSLLLNTNDSDTDTLADDTNNRSYEYCRIEI